MFRISIFIGRCTRRHSGGICRHPGIGISHAGFGARDHQISAHYHPDTRPEDDVSAPGKKRP